jgi:hypothetical protein
MVCYIMTTTASIIVLFAITYQALWKFCQPYRQLSLVRRLVCATHSAFFVLLGLQLVPQTILAIQILFKSWAEQDILLEQLSAFMGIFIWSHAAMYAVEACIRATVDISPVLLVHHLGFFAINMLAFWTVNMQAMVVGVILDWFIAHECCLYAVLVGYRLGLSPKWGKPLWWTAMIWYALTRIMQTILVGYTIIGFTMSGPLHPVVIVVAILCGALTAIQCYTFVIYYGMYKKMLRPSKQLHGKADIGASTIIDLRVDVVQQ